MTKCRCMSHILLKLYLSVPACEAAFMCEHTCVFHLYVPFSSEVYSYQLITIFARTMFKRVFWKRKYIYISKDSIACSFKCHELRAGL